MTRTRKLLVIGSINGAVEPLERLFSLLPQTAADGIAVLGDLAGPDGEPGTHKRIFRYAGVAARQGRIVREHS